MLLTLTGICVAFLFLLIVLRMKRASDRREMEQHSITGGGAPLVAGFK